MVVGIHERSHKETRAIRWRGRSRLEHRSSKPPKGCVHLLFFCFILCFRFSRVRRWHGKKTDRIVRSRETSTKEIDGAWRASGGGGGRCSHARRCKETARGSKRGRARSSGMWAMTTEQRALNDFHRLTTWDVPFVFRTLITMFAQRQTRYGFGLKGLNCARWMAPQLKRSSHKSGQRKTGAGLPELFSRVDTDRAWKPFELNARSR